MFKCKECESTEFQLVVQSEYEGMVEVNCNEHNEVVVRANNQEFIADLMFMNQFALCRQCGAIRSWDYFFRSPQLAM